jgi:hypothetical protein
VTHSTSGIIYTVNINNPIINKWRISRGCHGPAPKAIRNPLLSLAQEENRLGDLSRDFLTDRYRPSVKGNSLKPDCIRSIDFISPL